MRRSRYGGKVAEVVAVARPWPRGVPKNPEPDARGEVTDTTTPDKERLVSRLSFGCDA
jgi:hypothetical protein